MADEKAVFEHVIEAVRGRCEDLAHRLASYRVSVSKTKTTAGYRYVCLSSREAALPRFFAELGVGWSTESKNWVYHYRGIIEFPDQRTRQACVYSRFRWKEFQVDSPMLYGWYGVGRNSYELFNREDLLALSYWQKPNAIALLSFAEDCYRDLQMLQLPLHVAQLTRQPLSPAEVDAQVVAYIKGNLSTLCVNYVQQTLFPAVLEEYKVEASEKSFRDQRLIGIRIEPVKRPEWPWAYLSLIAARRGQNFSFRATVTHPQSKLAIVMGAGDLVPNQSQMILSQDGQVLSRTPDFGRVWHHVDQILQDPDGKVIPDSEGSIGPYVAFESLAQFVEQTLVQRKLKWLTSPENLRITETD